MDCSERQKGGLGERERESESDLNNSPFFRYENIQIGMQATGVALIHYTSDIERLL